MSELTLNDSEISYSNFKINSTNKQKLSFMSAKLIF